MITTDLRQFFAAAARGGALIPEACIRLLREESEPRGEMTGAGPRVWKPSQVIALIERATDAVFSAQPDHPAGLADIEAHVRHGDVSLVYSTASGRRILGVGTGGYLYQCPGTGAERWLGAGIYITMAGGYSPATVWEWTRPGVDEDLTGSPDAQIGGVARAIAALECR